MEIKQLLHKGEFTELWYYSNSNNQPFVRKFSAYPGDDKLENESIFIRDTLPEPAKEYFCRITRAKRDVAGRSFSYDMPYHRGRLLKDIVLDKNIGIVESINHIKASVAALNTTLYTYPSSEEPAVFAHKHYINRIEKRLSRYADQADRNTNITDIKIDALTKPQLDGVFRDIVSKSSVSLNGRNILTPLAILDRIKTSPSLMKIIMPQQGSMRLIHGDPHLRNTMIREEANKPLFFDPNGFHEGGDIAYDIGKLIISLDYVELAFENRLVLPVVSSNGSEITIENLKSFVDPELGIRSREIARAVIEDVLPEIFATELITDPGLLDRAIFAANLHAFAAAHTFIPTTRSEIALSLMLYYLEKTNNHLDLIEHADPNASAQSILLTSFMQTL